MTTDQTIAIFSSLIAASQERQEQAEQRRRLTKLQEQGTSKTAQSGIHSSPKPDDPAIIPDRAAPAR